MPDVLGLLLVFIEHHKAGSPTDADVYWIHLRPPEIAVKFEELHGIKISHRTIKRQLLVMNFRYRKLSKQLATGQYAHRDQQFKIIFGLVLLMSSKNPVISIDCKKKERIGNLYREGKCYVQGLLKVYDHDYNHLAKGKVIPFGIYDLLRNEGYISIGKSAETAEFIFDNLLWWWDHFGIHQYADAHHILILCDAGGANSYRHYAFKKQILKLAALIGKIIIICHYPPYASKWNPIEHRLFAHVHHAMKGAIFTDYLIVKELIEKTSTSTGLKVVVRIVDKHYPIGLKTNRNEVDFNRINNNLIIPELSYAISP